MKISHRIILVNLLIVAIVLGSAAIAFYSIMYKTLTYQLSQNVTSTSRNFNFLYSSWLEDIDNEFYALTSVKANSFFDQHTLVGKFNDFILETKSSNDPKIINYAIKPFIQLPQVNLDIEEFIKSNPYAIIVKHTYPDTRVFYYGKVFTQALLDDIAKRTGAEVALIWDSVATEVSNENLNSQYTFLISKAFQNLTNTKKQEIYISENDETDIIAAKFNVEKLSQYGNHLSLVFFKVNNAATDLRTTLVYILLLIGIVGILIALILSYVLTHRMRLRIAELNLATAQTSAGNFNMRIADISNDEIGNLGKAFNLMLDELQKNQKAKNEYSDFITLINKNASLTEISNAALKKILDTCNFLVGALYSVDGDEVSLICTYGLNSTINNRERNEFYKNLIQSKETVEIVSPNYLPVVQTGITDLMINYLLILPVIYNNKVIAILELGSINKPSDEAKEYLEKIQEQLAIGLTNAKALVQLENLVSELKSLNDEYQKQNIQIKKQHDTLLEMSKQLKTKAEELAFQKERAEDSTRLKSEFLASMSHELRTPMNSILGLTELILDKAQLSGKNRERLEVVLKSGKRLMNLINDILDLSKIEAGKMEVREEDVLLEELLEEINTTAQPLAKEKGLTFNIKRNCNTRIVINTDKGKINQVLINLIGNAVKFTHKGNIDLSVSILPDRTVQFSVKDTGIGISDEDKKLIFEEFRQLDGTTTRKYGGTGLGLAISKKIVDLLGGKISVNSILGQGSVFSFSFPFKYSHEKKKENNFNINAALLRQNRNNPVLIIDDDSEVRYTIAQYLNSRGYKTIFAEDGETGIKLAIEKQPFAITLDILLPNIDGWSVLRKLKENPLTKDIPVILISILGDKNIGYSLGAFEYLVKPFSSDNLLSSFSKLELYSHKHIQKIVIVDDDESEFEKFANEFKDDKLSIEYIKDSEYAFNKIAEVQPDLIILDLLMPKVDGISLANKLKSNNKTKQIPIIVNTAKDLTEEEKKSLNEIVEEIITKNNNQTSDVLKIVRDRIKMVESVFTNLENESNDSSESEIDNETTSPEYSAEVLIVDDDPDTLFTLNEMVQATGCKTLLAKSGIECLRILEQSRPDLILLDIMMPEMDGFQTLKNIRNNTDLIDIPIYAVTAKAMVGDKEIILKHGFNDYIAKPANSAIISGKISQLISRIKSN